MTEQDTFWLAALPRPTYDDQAAWITRRARTRRAIRDGEDVPEHVLDEFRHDPDTDDPYER